MSQAIEDLVTVKVRMYDRAEMQNWTVGRLDNGT